MEGSEDEGDSSQFINIRNQASLSLAGNFVDAAISFLGLVLFANVLGADGLGKFYLVLAVVRVSLFPISGIGQSVMKRGSERGLDPSSFFGGGLVYGGAYALIVGVVVALIHVVEPSLLKYSSEIVAGAFATFAARVFYMILLDVYRSRGKTGYATLIDNAHGIIETGGQVAFLLAGFGVSGLLAGTAITTIVVSISVLAVTEVEITRPSIKTLRSIARFARWSIVTSGLGTVYDRIPVLVLGAVIGDEAVGYYTSAMRLLMLGSYVGGSIAPALMVRVSAGSSDNEEALGNLRLSMQYAAILAIPMMFGSFAIPDALMVTIFGPTFSGIGAVLAALSIYHVVNTFGTVAYSFFDGIDRPDYSMKGTAASLAVRVIGILVLLPNYGLMGVIIAVLISHTTHLTIMELLTHYEFGKVIIPTRVSFQLLSGVLMWALVDHIAEIFPITGWPSLLLVVGVGAVAYVSLLLILDEYLRYAVVDIWRSSMKNILF